jgi:hypothetical protein
MLYLLHSYSVINAGNKINLNLAEFNRLDIHGQFD